MKILVIQLTRFGDILCTLPVLSALRREHGDAELHFLVRSRFAFAAERCKAVDHLWKMDTTRILGPLIGETPDVGASLSALTTFVRALREEKFDLIVNLSFTPSSSFVTHLIAGENIPVAGFTRTSDFFLRVPDAASEYFRAQVGLDRSNRLHVTDVMAWVAGVQVKAADFALRERPESPGSGIVCHLGASQAQKTWPAEKWVALLSRLVTETGRRVTIVGSKDERAYSENVALQVSCGDEDIARKIRVVAGETDFHELVEVIHKAELFIGADSGPLHAASLAGTKALNLSVGHVRFWETGPVTPGSRVLVSPDPAFLATDTVFNNALELLNGGNSREGYAECVDRAGVRYEVHANSEGARDHWPLVEWLYFGGPAPRYGGELLTALKQICEVCDLAVAQLENLEKSPQKTGIVAVLDRLDELLEIFRVKITPLAPLLDRYKTQKENIPPGPREEIFHRTRSCYLELREKASLLCGGTATSSESIEKGL